MQTGLAPGQAVPASHAPVASQCWGVLPVQPSLPGAQTPEQTPAEQTYEQAAAAFHAPVASHVSGTRPVQRLVPGAHDPLHDALPPLHT